MHTMEDFDKAVTDIQRKADDPNNNQTKEELDKEFFDAAIELWNNRIAGDGTLADGRNVTILTL